MCEMFVANFKDIRNTLIENNCYNINYSQQCHKGTEL